MKLALSWLESYFETKPDWDLVFNRLTMAGIEVESVEPIAPPFSGIVVAKVISCEKHPDADKLRLCSVDAGLNELLQIVCSASNVRAGIKVPCALVGGTLPDRLKIAECKMRGLTSLGMLCSGDELAMPNDVDGLFILPDDAPIGVSLRDYLGLDDKIVELKITPNRGDCLSVTGILREIATLTDYQIKPIVFAEVKPEIDDKLNIIIDEPKYCPNYFGLIIKDINNQVKLPKQILSRLERSGIRSISPVVDITNYVLLELGQPLHAFDLTKLGNTVQVRLACDAEQLKLLDGTEANLTEDTLVICNSQNQPSAIAGVMGGFDSGVTEVTTAIVIESAFFTPAIVAGVAKRYGVNSDAVYRYERGVDPQLQEKAALYAAALITQYCGGKVGILNHVTSDSKLSKPITLSYSRINQSIGANLSSEVILDILVALQFNFVEKTATYFTVEAPAFRFDIKIPEDIIEEIARIYGYDNIKPSLPVVQYTLEMIDQNVLIQDQLKLGLVNLGYSEIISYAFLEEKFEQLLGNPNINPVKLKNPIAGFSVMRTSLLADLVKNLLHNLHRGHKNIRIFEAGRVFYAEDEKSQPLKLAGLIYGNLYPPTWTNKNIAVDFFDLKHDVEHLLSGIDNVVFKPCRDYQSLHSGRCAKIFVGDQEIGVIGQLHPALAQDLGITQLPYVFELNLDFLTTYKHGISLKTVSKFQKVERDLAFILDQKINVGDVISHILENKVEDLIDINVFDVYQSGTLAASTKSIAINFIFQAEKTLTEDEINHKVTSIINLISTRFGAELRK